MLAKRNVDPKLEKLRNEIDGPPNLDTLILNFVRQTSRIHAGYLFNPEGEQLRRELCLALSSTDTGKVYSNWQDFGAALGLTIEQIRAIKYYFIGPEDPTYFVLLTYVQSFDSTLDKIIFSLQKINRLDVINRIKDHIENLIKALAHKGSDIKRVNFMKRAPEILRPPKQGKEISIKKIEDKGIKPQRIESGQHYNSIVLLSFAKNDLQTANRIAKLFRNKEPKIGVIILQEQEEYVFSRGEEFIDDCLAQVHYIVPILTVDYIRAMNSSISQETLSLMELDHKYLKYIYTMIRNKFARNCLNKQVRCIIPDKEISEVLRFELNPVLKVWFRESDIDIIAEKISLKKC
ncbi:uncharacterized protein LOC107270431 isoform X2 [Cephus cinctus]|uniref:Uncharacterized protein LOC107270431 isoform X2 n=1 Tax=Cephus cinctus TaxID=211228 RepID=A0AAJ7FNT3_CEPCN|nr:uncharacterized protein LOC107270431 isoform X2 [Cephus cinctus]